MNTSVDRETLRALVTSATRAPSSHNTQPWLFELGDREVRLLADRTRALPVNDPHDRELTISCGCALLNLRVAAQDAGFGTTVRILPDPDDADVLAVVKLYPASGVADELAGLAPYIEARRTHRKAFANRVVPDDVVD